MDVTDLVWVDATEQARLISCGEVTAVEVVQAHLDRIEAVGDRVNAFVTVASEQALEAAAHPLHGPLSGVPFTVKDAFDTAGVRTTCGSLLFADHVPAVDATAVARLRARAGSSWRRRTCRSSRTGLRPTTGSSVDRCLFTTLRKKLAISLLDNMLTAEVLHEPNTATSSYRSNSSLVPLPTLMTSNRTDPS